MAEKKRGKLVTFFVEARKELFERSTWPTRDEVIRQTIMVLVAVTVVSVGLWFVDWFAGIAVSALLDARSVIAALRNPIVLAVFAIVAVIIALYIIVRAMRARQALK